MITQAVVVIAKTTVAATLRAAGLPANEQITQVTPAGASPSNRGPAIAQRCATAMSTSRWWPRDSKRWTMTGAISSVVAPADSATVARVDIELETVQPREALLEGQRHQEPRQELDTGLGDDRLAAPR